jgi:hypothetical protein
MDHEEQDQTPPPPPPPDPDDLPDLPDSAWNFEEKGGDESGERRERD